MKKPKHLPENKISLQLPVKISFETIEDHLRERFVGENITQNKNGKLTKYAEILDLSLEKSSIDDFDIVLAVKFKTLTKFFKNKEGIILLYLSVHFDKEVQQVGVKDFKLDGISNNWLFDNSLEAIANTFMHEKLKNKMTFDFQQEMKKQLPVINAQLVNKMEVKEGIFLSGNLDTFMINDIIVGAAELLILIDLEGRSTVEIKKIVL
ncbi:DUF4403 family protein [Gillisia sp. M10.2A]|uniref:DUF4403 family protein n=1 Tax=Gillisia lutea TaxID=2909668 RepID=A0ABS9EI08_9FLAO|nr:DUF4403 family protein [Gillisia lutea]MCF4101400.1 DUF4403 family protein [Gillisia lutea]